MKPTDITKEKGVYIIEEDNNTKCRDKIQLTKDKYCVVRILFFTMGLVHFVPFTFFTTANDYWMYKFRDADNAIYDTSENRTTLQAHFSAAITIATNVPLVAFVLLTTTYGHYVSARKRVYYSIVLMLATFIISTIFIELNTDGWQTEFFILTMILISIINSGRAVYRISIFEIIPKFPSCSVAYFLAGEGLAGIFNSMLQILSLLVGTSTKTSALIYFISGSAVMLFAIGFYNFGERMTYYKAYASTEGYYKKNITFKDIIESSKIIWPSIIIILFLYIAQLTTSPSITSLVKSEASGNVWSETYFVPVITFLLNNVCDFIGRTVGSKVSKTLNGKLITLIMFVRMMVLVPLIMLCNAQPRNHLPVIFPHDYQYTLIIIAFGLSGGYFFSAAFISITSLPKEKKETAYAVLVIYLGFIGAVFSVLSFFWVDLL